MANQTSCLLVQADGTLVVREVDGSPELTDISILEVPNGTLSNPSPGVPSRCFPIPQESKAQAPR